ncbi:DUF5131 family protein [Bremerella sp. P1]|uniref:DUF5131 family protein n=1 Tax=Bremerella sp. P1 TaxID=3026424 RepID=UPI0023677250|nr:DUF5131 family protein [Bremerella sp. P1]WDI43706.1 DUF5131 family protein [Bremerella sp. P1]
MAQSTAIQWCDSTVNPVMGCAGCELWTKSRKTCYAGALHKRLSKNPGFSPEFLRPKLFPGRLKKAAAWSDLTGRERATKPWLNGLPRLIFVSDMGDALSETGAINEQNEPLPGGEVPFEFLKSEIVDAALSDKGQRHRWLWLTKRPNRLASFSNWLQEEHDLQLPENIWIGTSVTSKATLSRVADLVEVGHEETTRFLSVEPLWEEVSLAEQLDMIAWVIVGGESEQGCDPKSFQCDWARRLRDECATAGVPFFLKQLGASPVEEGTPLKLKDSHGGEWNEWPSDLHLRQTPFSEYDEEVDVEIIYQPPPSTTLRKESYILASDIDVRPVEWLWHHRIPLGELTMVDGDPATNKSSMLIDLAARVSNGQEMPDGTPGIDGGVLLLLAEESIRKTVPLRLEAAGADLKRTAVMRPSLSLPDAISLLQDAAHEIGARLVIIDPVMAFLTSNANREQPIRQAMTELKEFAERSNVAIIMVRHLNKGGGKQSLYRGVGSIGLIAATRSGFLVGHAPDDPDMRVMCHTKSNLGPLAPSLLFEPIPADNGSVRVEWRGLSDYTAEDVLKSTKNGNNRLEEAKEYLLEVLAEGPVEQQKIKSLASESGLAWRTVERAKEFLGVRSSRNGWGPGSHCVWQFDQEGPEASDT